MLIIIPIGLIARLIGMCVDACMTADCSCDCCRKKEVDVEAGEETDPMLSGDDA